MSSRCQMSEPTGRISESSRPASPTLPDSSTGTLLLFLLQACRFTVNTPLPALSSAAWLWYCKSAHTLSQFAYDRVTVPSWLGQCSVKTILEILWFFPSPWLSRQRRYEIKTDEAGLEPECERPWLCDITTEGGGDCLWVKLLAVTTRRPQNDLGFLKLIIS